MDVLMFGLDELKNDLVVLNKRTTTGTLIRRGRRHMAHDTTPFKALDREGG